MPTKTKARSGDDQADPPAAVPHTRAVAVAEAEGAAAEALIANRNGPEEVAALRDLLPRGLAE